MLRRIRKMAIFERYWKASILYGCIRWSPTRRQTAPIASHA
ncbi:uncharacterized protein AruCF_5707 [Achromobacter ruhlandii]|nr:uncharacterized protein AruCF_5707 [Achromobacter ruhlandii]